MGLVASGGGVVLCGQREGQELPGGCVCVGFDSFCSLSSVKWAVSSHLPNEAPLKTEKQGT